MSSAIKSPFLCGHATHPEARMALALVAAQLDAQRAQQPGFVPTLGLLYITDAYAAQAEALLADAQARWPALSIVGTTGIGVCAGGVEYFDEPALVLMLADLPREHFSVFNGMRALLDPQAWTALVHADPALPELAELVGELAERTGARYLFGGLASGRGRTPQFADGVFEGGLSGVAFHHEIGVISRVTQGCQPVGPTHRVTAAERNVVLTLDHQPALKLLLADLGETGDIHQALSPQSVQKLRGTLVGLSDADDDARGRGGEFGADTRVRGLIGIDPAREAIAVGDIAEPGMGLSFCSRHVAAARRDLVRICTEIREEVEADEAIAETAGHAAEATRRQIAGAVYVSCTGRGGPHFGGPSAELQIVRQALGDVPLAGFFAAGEIGRHHLYGYTGVLTVFLTSS
ncbi:MAG TPA: FIST N-terminal domain-containing protein [Ideonella sp.]|nr:FIST N-terminal domain-containing protein [Ideonella sp.]